MKRVLLDRDLHEGLIKYALKNDLMGIRGQPSISRALKHLFIHRVLKLK